MENPINPASLSEIRKLQNEIGENLLVELIDLYLKEAPMLIDAVEKAVLDQDLPALEKAAHRLKGSSAYLGLTQVSGLSAELEADARAGSNSDFRQKLIELKALNQAGIAALLKEKEKELAA